MNPADFFVNHIKTFVVENVNKKAWAMMLRLSYYDKTKSEFGFEM